MIIDNTCIGCKECIPYCPVNAIKYNSDERITSIEQDECVECGVCYRANVCPVDAIVQPELTWPRTIRRQFSDPTAYRHPTAIGGRGTDEMKTNDVTNRFKLGEVGLCIEFGRPGIGARFDDLEKVAISLVTSEVEFEPENPTSVLINTNTGKLNDESIRNEKVLSCIIECKTSEKNIVDVFKKLHEASKDINTVISVGVISKCINNDIPAKSILESAGFRPAINGKINLGLGKV